MGKKSTHTEWQMLPKTEMSSSIDANALLNITPTPYYESLPTTVSDSMATFDPGYGGRGQPVATVPPEKAKR